MREVFVHQDTARVGLYKSILDANDIPNFVRNGLSNNSLADMPAAIFFPTLCVVDDADYERAIEILRHVHKPEPSDSPDWKCAECHEEVPGTFEHCWKCGADRVSTPDVAEDNSRTERLGDSAKAVTPESALHFASIFRWLVLVNVLMALVGFWLYPQLERHPPPSVKQWIEEQDRIPEGLRNIASLAWSVRPVLWGITQLLCFLLWNPGRLFLIAAMACDILIGAVLPPGLFPPWVNVLTYFEVLISGAMLTLVYLSPLKQRFGSSSQGR